MNDNEAARLRDADQHVCTFVKAMASLEAFGQAYWSLDRVLSWITYRDRFQLDTPYLRGTSYPTMLGVPPVIEPAASTGLLQAIRRAANPIICYRDGKELHGSEWEPANYPSNPKRWPQGVFAREAVLREWPQLVQPAPLSDQTSPPSSAMAQHAEPSRADVFRSATTRLPSGLQQESRKKGQLRHSPFAEALSKEAGLNPTKSEWLTAWKIYNPNPNRGRPKNASENAGV